MLRLFVVVSFSRQAAADSLRDVGGSLAPDVLVEFDINTDILGTHFMKAKSLMALTALAARNLRPWPWIRLCTLMVYSRVTTSLIADRFFWLSFLAILSG